MYSAREQLNRNIKRLDLLLARHICPQCDKEFHKLHTWQKFCSVYCQRKAADIRFKKLNKESLRRKEKKFRETEKYRIIKDKYYSRLKETEEFKETQRLRAKKYREKIKDSKEYREKNRRAMSKYIERMKAEGKYEEFLARGRVNSLKYKERLRKNAPTNR